jgi:hypothetical protein
VVPDELLVVPLPAVEPLVPLASEPLATVPDVATGEPLAMLPLATRPVAAVVPEAIVELPDKAAPALEPLMLDGAEPLEPATCGLLPQATAAKSGTSPAKSLRRSMIPFLTNGARPERLMWVLGSRLEKITCSRYSQEPLL